MMTIPLGTVLLVVFSLIGVGCVGMYLQERMNG